MHPRLLLLALFLAVAQCLAYSPAFAAMPSDAQLRTMLAGRWSEDRDLGCEKHQQVIDIRADGTFKVSGTIRYCDASPVNFVWDGKWRVRNARFLYVTTNSSPKDMFPLGEELSDQIISVTEREWVMREGSTGNESRAFKIK